MNDLRLKRAFENVDLTIGVFTAHSSLNIFTDAGFIYATYEARPRLLEVTLVNPGEPRRALSDDDGLSNYGGLFYERGDIGISQYALFADIQLLMAEKLDIEAGFRYEYVGHNGLKDRFAPLEVDGGIDQDPLTVYDNNILVGSTVDNIAFNYDYLSFSIAANYSINDHFSSYLRYSRSHKAPEVNYYLNNFSNVGIDGPGKVQDINQLELGIKYLSAGVSIAATGFFSKLSDVAYSEFVFDESTNSIFYTPAQFNSSRTIGLEMEWNQAITQDIGIYIGATIQDPRLNDFLLYDASGTIDVSDDRTLDFSDKLIPHNPKLSFNASLYHEAGRFTNSLTWRYMGERYGNFENAFVLGAYGVFDYNLNYSLSKNVTIGLAGKNIFNSAGLINFFGPNEFGSNANQATSAYISANPLGSFVVFPILPRTILVSIGYRFKKV